MAQRSRNQNRDLVFLFRGASLQPSRSYPRVARLNHCLRVRECRSSILLRKFSKTHIGAHTPSKGMCATGRLLGGNETRVLGRDAGTSRTAESRTVRCTRYSQRATFPFPLVGLRYPVGE